jgi:hypothetical protein
MALTASSLEAGGDVEQLLRGLQLITVKLMHQGSTARAKPKCQDDVSITELGELMALLGEPLNVTVRWHD